jgi:DNA-binding HxlR family transcriptional regulator
MTTPRPGRSVRGSRSGRPLMAALDLLGRRHALRVLFELRGGALRFRELAARCGDVSPSVLNQRLRELRGSGLLARDAAAGYRLTARGAELGAVLSPLVRWSEVWAHEVPAPPRPARRARARQR